MTATDTLILNLAEKLDAMPTGSRVQLPARPGCKRLVSVERLVGGQWAAWNVGRDNGLLVSDPIEMAERVISVL